MAYDKPNYTQAPNVFFDQHLPEIKSMAELKVTLLVFRGTFGWHEKEVDLTIVEMMKQGGMARQTVLDGVQLALERGTIRRRKSGRSFAYEANVLSVQNLDRSPKTIGLESRPIAVQNVDQSSDHSLLEKERKEINTTPQGGNGSGAGKRNTATREPRPRRPDAFPVPPDSCLESFPADREWVKANAPNVPDANLATMQWYRKQVANGIGSKTIIQWRASWESYLITWSMRAANGNGFNSNGAGKEPVRQKTVLEQMRERGERTILDVEEHV